MKHRLLLLASKGCLPCEAMKEQLDTAGYKYEELDTNREDQLPIIALYRDYQAVSAPTLYVYDGEVFIKAVTNYKELKDWLENEAII